MSINELLPSLRDLDRADKFRAMQFLIHELAKEEALLNKTSYPVWSPYDSFEAANVLLEALNTEQNRA